MQVGADNPMRYHSFDNEDLRIQTSRSSSAKYQTERSAEEESLTPRPTREWAHDVLAHTPLYKSIDTASLAHLGAKSFAAYKQKKKQLRG